MKTRQFEIYAPLQNFFWRGNDNDFELAPGLWIKHYNQKPDLQGLDAELASSEQSDIDYLGASHWLTFHWVEGTDPSPAETVNLVLLALWLVKHSPSRVAFRFQVGQGATADRKSIARLYDRFVWVKDTSQIKFDRLELQSSSSYYLSLRDICCSRGRLNNALILTMRGCCSIDWQVAFICHAAAVEALLTYSTAPGITKRLAISYVCLVETQKTFRDAAYKEFCTLYSIRSDIMHGRTHTVDPAQWQPLLARFQKVLRTLWRMVILAPQLIATLEGSDAQRKNYFAQLASSYTPPHP